MFIRVFLSLFRFIFSIIDRAQRGFRDDNIIYFVLYDDSFDDERVFDRRWWWLWSGFFLFFFSLLLLFCGKDGGIDFAIIVFDDECDEEEAV